MTEETQAGTVAAEQTGIDKTIGAPPVQPGFIRTYWDRPINNPPPPPLIEQVFDYVESEARRFDAYATKLYAEAASVLAEKQRAECTYHDLVAAAQAQLKLDAIYCAMSNLTAATDALRRARIALSPYVDPDKISKLY